MNKVKKGDDFEKLVYNIFKELLENDKLPFNSKFSEIFQKKKYYSSKRESNIIFDIAIEVYHPGTKEISLIAPIECKNYSSDVSVDNIEEFYSKARQVGDLNIKAIFVTTSLLQAGALTFAKNSKMAVARILPEEQVEWINYSISLEEMEKKMKLQSNIIFVSHALTSDELKVEGRNFFGLIGNKTFDSFESLLANYLK